MSNDNMTANSETANQVFVDALKQNLDESAQALPASVTSRLRQAREQALVKAESKANKKTSWFDFSVLIRHPMMASCASVLTVALVVGYIQLKPTGVDETLIAMDKEAEILFADEDLELYEDLEFYSWLASTGY